MFTKTRLTLTAWYLLIIMLISIAFSLVIYRGAEMELQRSLRLQTLRFQREQGIFLPPGVFPQINTELMDELDDRIKITLLLINLGILVFSGAAGYFLAGKTLKPIEKMLDEQKRFVADASHELRTPLTVMRTEIEVAMRDKKLNLAAAIKLLKSNLEETNKMQSLSNYLLSLSKYQANNGTFKKEVFELRPIINNAIEKFSLPVKEKGLVIIFKGHPITIATNKESFTELVNILLDNAVKYSFPKTKITITTEKINQNILLSVHNQGIAIDKADLPHIFDRFYRADTSRSKVSIQGYGLGLSIAKEIIDRHGGTINVISSAKNGTTFKIKL